MQATVGCLKTELIAKHSTFGRPERRRKKNSKLEKTLAEVQQKIVDAEKCAKALESKVNMAEDVICDAHALRKSTTQKCQDVKQKFELFQQVLSSTK